MSATRKQALACDTDTAPDILIALAQDDNPDVRLGVAGNTSTPPIVLGHLSEDLNVGVRFAVAINNSTPPSGILALTKDRSPWNRAQAARKTDSTNALRRLASDSNWYVRNAVADNPRTPAEVLAVLVDDQSEPVRNRAVARTSNQPRNEPVNTQTETNTTDECEYCEEETAVLTVRGVRFCSQRCRVDYADDAEDYDAHNGIGPRDS